MQARINGNAPGPQLLHASWPDGDPELWKMLAGKTRAAIGEVVDDEARRILTLISEGFEMLERISRGERSTE